MATCLFKGKPRRLRLSWVIGVYAILSRLMVEWPSLVEKRLHYLAETWSCYDRRRGEYGGNFCWSPKDCNLHSTSCRLCERMGVATTSWTRLVRVTAYVLRFIKNSKREKNSQPGKKLPRFPSCVKPPTVGYDSYRKFTFQRSGVHWSRTSLFQNPVH